MTIEQLIEKTNEIDNMTIKQINALKTEITELSKNADDYGDDEIFYKCVTLLRKIDKTVNGE